MESVKSAESEKSEDSMKIPFILPPSMQLKNEKHTPLSEIYRIISSEEFDNWYGTRKRDSDGIPQVNKFLEIYGENLIAGSLLRKTISLKSVEDVTKLFSSNATQGIGKYQSAYYITKNNREQGIKMYDTLNAHYPGLLTLATRWKQTAAIGVTDRSEPVIKININEDVFNQGSQSRRRRI